MDIRKPYICNDNILETLRSQTTSKLDKYNEENPLFDGTKLNRSLSEREYRELTEDIYIIVPNPMDNKFKMLVYELENINYFYPIDNSRKIQQNLKKQYKNFNTEFRKFISYDYFIKHLTVYEEPKILSRNILLKDGFIYNFEEMKFNKKCYEVPTAICNKEFKALKENNYKILDKCFNLMYPSETKLKQFFYYILCNFDKEYQKQNIFLIIDKSGVGKTAKILPMVNLKLNKIFQSGLLKPTELYNIAGKNSIIYNETQTDKNINGSDLSLLADSTPLTVTRKNDNSLDIEPEEKPLLQIMGESLPFIKALNDGTNRRFLLVPKASLNFLEFKSDPKNKSLINDFYTMLYDNPIQVVQYYIKKIKELDIFNNVQSINKSMVINLKELEQLLESKELIFETYFELDPYGKYEECIETRYLLDIENLDRILEYIDNNIITTGHFNNTALRRKYLRNLIKENKGVSNLKKDIGVITSNKHTYFFCYCLTLQGVELVKTINDNKMYSENITYYTYEY